MYQKKVIQPYLIIEPVNIKMDHVPEKGNTTVSNYRTSQY